jgi:hypothetical protein
MRFVMLQLFRCVIDALMNRHQLQVELMHSVVFGSVMQSSTSFLTVRLNFQTGTRLSFDSYRASMRCLFAILPIKCFRLVLLARSNFVPLALPKSQRDRNPIYQGLFPQVV